MQKARTHRTNRATGTSPGDQAETAKQLSEAEALRLGGKPDKARRICTGLLNRFPDYPAAHHTMGLVLADMHNYSQALSHLVRAQMHDPDNWKVLTALAGVYLRMGASAMAARTLEQAATLRPGDAGTLITLGEIYRGDREYELAVNAFRKSAAAGGGGAAQYGLGLCLMELGQMEEAAGLFDGLVAKGNRSITTLNALSEMAPDLVKCDLLALIEDAERLPDQSQEFFDMARRFTLAAALDSAGRHQEAWSRMRCREPGFRRRSKARLAGAIQVSGLCPGGRKKGQCSNHCLLNRERVSGIAVRAWRFAFRQDNGRAADRNTRRRQAGVRKSDCRKQCPADISECQPAGVHQRHRASSRARPEVARGLSRRTRQTGRVMRGFSPTLIQARLKTHYGLRPRCQMSGSF